MTKIDKLPSYYVGKYKKIKAYDVMNDYELTYNVATACTYLLRSGKKPQNPAEQDIEKAIKHLQFELERIKLQKEQGSLEITATFMNECSQIDEINNNFFNGNGISTY